MGSSDLNMFAHFGKTRIKNKQIYIYHSMVHTFKLKKGLDIVLQGAAQPSSVVSKRATAYAVCPTDFWGITPRLSVKEGDKVLAGDVLFVDKATEKISFVSPVSGTVKAVVRGERRKILHVLVEADASQEAKDFSKQVAAAKDAASTEALLLEAGFFALLRQRPYDCVPTPGIAPKGIFVSAFSKMPLAADFSFVVKGQEDDFLLGIATLGKIAKVHLGVAPEQANAPFTACEAEVNVFAGKNPAGNVGVQINHVSPVNKGEVVWTLGAEEVIMLGRLMRTGKVDFTRTIALAGSQVNEPKYVKTIIGTPMADLLKGEYAAGNNVRIIDGNPLVGCKSSLEGFLGAHTTEVCIIPEGDDVNELFGWIAPRFNDFSTNRSYFSWLLPKKNGYNLDCRIKGGERHMIMSCEYEKVFPMDILPSYLIKAIITGDIDRQEALGIYEVAPEDFAVAEFVCSSKLELQRIVREGLEILRKENA